MLGPLAGVLAPVVNERWFAPPPLRANVEGVGVKPNLYVVQIHVKIIVNVNQYVNQNVTGRQITRKHGVS